MTIKAATPYLILNGKAAEAVPFYQRALGAEVIALQRFGEVQNNCPEAMKNSVMHAELRAGEATLMMSDGSPDTKQTPGGAVNVALNFDNSTQARKCFEALSEKGAVFQPLMDAPWGALFGALQDQYGVNWMFNSAK